MKLSCFLAILVIVVAYHLEQAEATGPKACKCAKIYKPVCGKDGKTYPNECELGCRGVDKANDGECEEKKTCVCTRESNPQCGVDGKTYGNECMLQCAKVEKKKGGRC